MSALDVLRVLREAEDFDWDKANQKKNWEKHKVAVKECEEVFFNEPLLLFEDEKHSGAEKRFGAFGITNKGRRLAIIFTFRENITISSRSSCNLSFTSS